jgi:hypothetical protein
MFPELTLIMDLTKLLHMSGIVTESYTLLEAVEDNVANNAKFKGKVMAAYNHDRPLPAHAEGLQSELDVVKWISTNFIPAGKAPKFLARIVGWYVDGAFHLHDYPQIKPAIAYFDTSTAIENKNIQAPEYNDYSHFMDVVEQVMAKTGANVKATSQQAAVKGLSAYGDIIIDSANFKVIRAGSKAQSIAFWDDLIAPYRGKDTPRRWCTTVNSDKNMFDHYTANGKNDHYFLLAGSGAPNTASVKKYGYLYEFGELQREDNENIIKHPEDIEYLSQFPGYKDFLNMEIKKHYKVEE